jgi:outer membrane protein insertion porin family
VIQKAPDLIKILFFLGTICFLFPHQGFSQTVSDTTKLPQIQNPLLENPQQYQVLGIKVTGLTKTSPAFVISQLGFKKGSTITVPGTDLAKGLKRVYQTGLFTKVQIFRTKTTAGGIYLEVHVREQPKLKSFKISGVKKSQRDDLRKRLNLLPGFAVTKTSERQAISSINQYYKQKGYWFTHVKVQTGPLDTLQNNETLTFHVNPGKKLEVKKITFKGNHVFSGKTLRKALGSIKEDRWWNFFKKRTLKKKELDKAKQNLEQFYGAHGYLDFQIKEDTVETFYYDQTRLYFLHTPATGLKVQFTVSEGPQYYVRNITWNGNTVYTNQQLSQVLNFHKGDVFNKKKYQSKFSSFSPNKTTIGGLYQNAGYLFSQIRPSIHVVHGDSVDIDVNIFEDEKATIKKVTFSGNTKTSDDVVRRNLHTIPGNTYSQQAVIRTVRELGTIGFFDPKSIKPNLSPDRKDKTVNINYDLTESKSTDNFQFSGGYGGSRIGVILSARVQFNNFSLQRAIKGEGWNPIPSGDGEKLSLGAQVSGKGYQSYNAGFQQPWLGGKPTSLGVNFSYNRLNYGNVRGLPGYLSNAKEKLFSSSVSIGRRLKWPDNYFKFQSILSYQLYDVHNAAFLAEGTSNILSLTEVLSRNSLDNFISPTRGSKLQISGQFAPPLPGFSQFYKFKALYQNNATIVGDLVLTNTIQYGYLGYFGPSQHSNFKRFVIGGTKLQQRQSFINDNIDMRGYPGGQGRAISPRTANGQEIGGRIFTKYSLELRIPAVQNKKLKVIPYVFFDAGNAYRNFLDFEPFNLKRAVGPGVRLYLPILGLIDISYGYRLDGLPATYGTNYQVLPGKWQFLFNIGSSFR